MCVCALAKEQGLTPSDKDAQRGSRSMARKKTKKQRKVPDEEPLDSPAAEEEPPRRDSEPGNGTKAISEDDTATGKGDGVVKTNVPPKVTI